jgi:hypothetical protein
MYRDAVAEKLTDVIMDDDEFGKVEGYNRSDEEFFDLGDKLWRLNQILNNLPPDETPTQSGSIQTNPTANSGPIDLSTFVIQQGIPRPTWQDFVAAVEGENRNEAAKILAALAGLNVALAFQATNVFAAQYALYPEEFKGKAMSLRAQLAAGAPGSVRLIYELFGIVGPMADQIYKSLRSNV